MRKFLSVVIAGALLLGTAGTASAEILNWHGTLQVQLGSLEPLVVTGKGNANGGAATVNMTGGLGHLDWLQLGKFHGPSSAPRAGISGTATVPVTDPAEAPLNQLIGTMILGNGVLGPISATTLPGLTIESDLNVTGTGIGTMPVHGIFKMCILFGACVSFLPVPLTMNGGATGIGVGGLIPVNAYGPGIQISVVGAPWTVHTAVVTGIPTGNSFTTSTVQGFVHGPASGTSSTANISGVVQLVSPAVYMTTVGTGTKEALFSILTIHFVPEPQTFLLFAAGLAALGIARHGCAKK